MSRERLLLALAAFCGALSSCDPGETVMRARHHLVDPALRADAAPAPVATILDETRPVLRGYPSRHLLTDREAAPSAEGRISRRAALGSRFPHARRLVLTARVRREGSWVALPAWATPVVGEGGARFVEVELALSGIESFPVDLRLRGRVPPDGAETIHETLEVDMPRDAALEFGIGILEPGWSQGPVEFSLSACESGSCDPLFAETLDPGRREVQGWNDRRLSLDAYAGNRISFRFQTRHRQDAEGNFTFPVWSNPTIYAPERRGADEFNIILFSIDTLRADHLTSYGYARDTAPFIDRELARRGTLFERCTSAATTTGPSHMTMFTSLQPSVHGVRGHAGLGPLPEAAVTLAEALRAGGFETGAVTENGALNVGLGFARGFDEYVENTGAEGWGRGYVEQTLQQGRAWMEAHRDRRFFLFLHTYQVHSPYAPPPEYADLFTEPIPGVPRHPALPESSNADLYDREIRFVDDVLSAFYTELEEGILAGNTLFVLTSDHGEGFLEHGLLAHGANIFDEVLRVPLILRGPGVPENRRVGAGVGLVDLMPTLLDLAGVTPPPGGAGRSFAGLLGGEPDGAAWSERPLYSEAWQERAWGPGGTRFKISQPSFAVRVGTRKLVRLRAGDGFRYAYYDLARDPGERVDRYPDEQDRADPLRALVDRYPELTAALHAELAAAPDRDPGRDLGPDEAHEEKLRALGYID